MSILRSPINGHLQAKKSKLQEVTQVKDCLTDLKPRSMVKAKKKVSGKEQSFKVSARQVPTEELLKLFGEIENNMFNNEKPSK